MTAIKRLRGAATITITQQEKLKITVDRKTILEKFESVRRIRNEVMHFDPDGIPEKDLQILREFARFLQKLQTIDVIDVESGVKKENGRSGRDVMTDSTDLNGREPAFNAEKKTSIEE